MPTCSAIGCQNKAYIRFPKDKNRRRKWVENMEHKTWTPLDSSRICEIHFEPRMWEKVRVDGKKKLRSSAIPTIFDVKINKSAKVEKYPIDPLILSPSEEMDFSLEDNKNSIFFLPSNSSSFLSETPPADSIKEEIKEEIMENLECKFEPYDPDEDLMHQKFVFVNIRYHDQ